MSANNDLVHVVFFAGAIWGHARPAVQVSITLCRRSPNLVISLLVPENLVPKAKKAIDLMLAEATSDASLAGDVRARLKIVGLTPPAGYETPANIAGSVG